MVKNVVEKLDWTLYDHGSNSFRSYEIPSGGSDVELTLTVPTAGRLGMYQDYSELNVPGNHVFYVNRTHGTSGQVSVDYATSGDTHTTVSGTLTWQDGEADIKTVTVPVTSGNLSTHDTAGLGEHRIVLTLSNATGGAVLHRDATSGNWTRAYGIIDSSTMIASDTNAWFFNADAGSDGTGTQASPFNTWGSLRSAQNTTKKRYIYMRGTYVPEDIWIDMDSGGASMGGSSEATRTYIMQWPGQTLTITSDAGADHRGFYSDSSGNNDYITWKNITFNGLSNINQTSNGPGFCWRARTTNAGWTIENCSVVDHVQGQNSGQASIFLEGNPVGANVYKTLIQNPQRANGNPGVGIESYDGGTHSVTSCTFTNSTGIYQKDAPQTGEFGMTVRHCVFGPEANLFLDNLGTNPDPTYQIVQGNIFYYYTQNIYTKSALNFARGTGAASGTGGAGIWMVGNIIAGSGGNNGNNFSVLFDYHESGITVFNNIWVDGYGFMHHWGTTSGNDIEALEFLNYNHSNNVPVAGVYRWEFGADGYTTTTAFNTATGFAANHSTGDPLFNNLAGYDVTLKAGSPCIGTGVSGTDKGAYLTGAEQIGAA